MQKPEPQLRLATNADAPAVQELISGILHEYSLQPDPTNTDADLLDLENHCREGWFNVLECGNTIIGTVALLPLEGGTWGLRKMLPRQKLAWPRPGQPTPSGSYHRSALERRSKSCAGHRQELEGSHGFSRSREPHPAERCDQVWELALS